MTKAEIYKEAEKARELLKDGIKSGHYAQAMDDSQYILFTLLEKLKNDVRSEANKKNGAGKLEKILKDIFNNAAHENNVKMMQYSTIRNGKQYALDGHRLLEINTPINAPVWERDAENGDIQSYYQVERIMQETPALEVISPDLMELKAFNKYYKKSEKTCVILETVNGKKITINSRYLENALTNLSNPKIYASEEMTARSPIYIVSEEARVLILPINFDAENFAPGCYTVYGKKRFTLETASEEEAEKVA